MICESCNKETNRVITEVADVGGRKVVIKYCPECPVDTDQGKRYEKHVIKKRRGRPPKNGLARYIVPEDEIKETQKLKPSSAIVDAEKLKDMNTRNLDLASPDREKFFIGAYANSQDFSGWRETKIAEKANGKFGWNKWKKIHDTGEWVTVERVA